MHRSLHFKITGRAPLLMHNGRLANPLDEYSRALKKITTKRQKTEADIEAAAKIEFLGSLYLYNGEPCLPGEVLEGALIQGAKRIRRGPQVKAGLLCERAYPLEYDGPRNPYELWESTDFRYATTVRLSTGRTLRMRPIFRSWTVEFDLLYEPSLLNEDEVRDLVQLVGATVGLGDWRPKFGRYGIA